MTTHARQRITRDKALAAGTFLGWIAACSLTLLSAHTIDLEWDPSLSPEVTGYRVYFAKDGQPPQRLTAGNKTTFTLTGLEPGATYTLYATAYDESGRESPPSNTLTYQVPPPPPPPPPPPNPYGVPVTSFTLNRSGHMLMTWESIPGTAYRILFKDHLSEPAWRVLATELLAGSESLYFVDRAAAQVPQRFYRLQWITDTPKLSPPNPTTQGLELNWSSRPGRTYRVLATSDLNRPDWKIIAQDLPATAETLQWTDPASTTAAKRFYRVELDD